MYEDEINDIFFSYSIYKGFSKLSSHLNNYIGQLKNMMDIIYMIMIC